MHFLKYISATILLSTFLTGCGGGSSSSVADAGSGDTGTGDTGSGDSDTGSGDSGTGDSGSGDTDTGDTDPTVTESNFTYTRVIAGQTLTVNFTITESHQNEPNKARYRVWDYANPAIIKNGSSEQKIYFYDQYTDIDEEALGGGEDQGFIKDEGYRKDTHTYSSLSTVKSNQFIMTTTESLSSYSGEIELLGINHHKIESQTFSNDTPPNLIDEEFLTIVEDVDTLGPCDNNYVSLGEMVRYSAKGFWQIGDSYELVMDIHSPIFTCDSDGNPTYNGHASLLSTAKNELTGYLDQVTSEGKSFNYILEFSDTETIVSQDSGNTIIKSNAKSYNQLHTGEVVYLDEDCLILQNAELNELCTRTKEVASNLPTIPTL